MHKSATKYNETIGKWCKNKHGVSKIIDTLETYQGPIDSSVLQAGEFVFRFFLPWPSHFAF
jgi:hypothetical protein